LHNFTNNFRGNSGIIHQTFNNRKGTFFSYIARGGTETRVPSPKYATVYTCSFTNVAYVYATWA